MRHRVHEEVDQLTGKFSLSLDQIYLEASKFLSVDTDQAHVGMLGISQCKTLIKNFMSMRGIDLDENEKENVETRFCYRISFICKLILKKIYLKK